MRRTKLKSIDTEVSMSSNDKANECRICSEGSLTATACAPGAACDACGEKLAKIISVSLDARICYESIRICTRCLQKALDKVHDRERFAPTIKPFGAYARDQEETEPDL